MESNTNINTNNNEKTLLRICQVIFRKFLKIFFTTSKNKKMHDKKSRFSNIFPIVAIAT